MSVADPTPELLMAYALGALSSEESVAVRRWLLVQTDDRVLDAYRAAEEDAGRRRARLAHWAERPIRARLEHTVWRARAHITDKLELVSRGDDARRILILAPLGSSVSKGAYPRLIEVPPGSTIDLSVKPETAGHLAALGVDDRGDLHVLHEDQLVSPGDWMELGGFVLEGGEDMLDVYLVFSPSAQVPMPTPGDDAIWLVELLEQLDTGGDLSFVRYVFTPASTGRGKQP